jgi:hypothetical protein
MTPIDSNRGCVSTRGDIGRSLTGTPGRTRLAVMRSDSGAANFLAELQTRLQFCDYIFRPGDYPDSRGDDDFDSCEHDGREL